MLLLLLKWTQCVRGWLLLLLLTLEQSFGITSLSQIETIEFISSHQVTLQPFLEGWSVLSCINSIPCRRHGCRLLEEAATSLWLLVFGWL